MLSGGKCTTSCSSSFSSSKTRAGAVWLVQRLASSVTHSLLSIAHSGGRLVRPSCSASWCTAMRMCANACSVRKKDDAGGALLLLLRRLSGACCWARCRCACPVALRACCAVLITRTTHLQAQDWIGFVGWHLAHGGSRIIRVRVLDSQCSNVK
jgi:hypothetical protein